MTIHAPHPDTHEHGLQDGCARCEELAADPFNRLDETNLRRIVQLACSRTRHEDALTHLDLVASTHVLNALERLGAVARAAPAELVGFLGRYGFHATLLTRVGRNQA